MRNIISILAIVISLILGHIDTPAADSGVTNSRALPPVEITDECVVPIAYDVNLTDVQRAMDRADEFLAEDQGFVVSWCDIEVRAMADHVTDNLSAWYWIRFQDQHEEERVVMGFTGVENNGACGYGQYPVAQVSLTDTCNIRGWIIAIHELMHVHGAVADDAPGSDGNSHSTVRGDIMMAGPIECVDCLGDAYFNPNPIPGGFLETNPEYNAALSPLFIPAPPPVPVPDPELEPIEDSPPPSGERVVTRLSGPNRFETAAAVALHTYPEGSSVAYLVDADAGADALVAASVSEGFAGPILYTTKSGMPQVTRDTLDILGVSQLFVVGGEGVVPDHATR